MYLHLQYSQFVYKEMTLKEKERKKKIIIIVTPYNQSI